MPRGRKKRDLSIDCSAIGYTRVYADADFCARAVLYPTKKKVLLCRKNTGCSHFKLHRHKATTSETGTDNGVLMFGWREERRGVLPSVLDHVLQALSKVLSRKELHIYSGCAGRCVAWCWPAWLGVVLRGVLGVGSVGMVLCLFGVLLCVVLALQLATSRTAHKPAGETKARCNTENNPDVTLPSSSASCP